MTAPRKRVSTWPSLVLIIPASVAIWGGWVSLGAMCGFGVVHPLPGIVDNFSLDLAVCLPLGMEVYSTWAIWVWLSGRAPERARRFAARSAVAGLVLGAGGQVAYHVMSSWGWSSAPWPVITAVACIPVAVLGLGAALAHLIRSGELEEAEPDSAPVVDEQPAETLPTHPLVGFDLEALFAEIDIERAAEQARVEGEQAAARARAERDQARADRAGLWAHLADALHLAGRQPSDEQLRAWLRDEAEVDGKVPGRAYTRGFWRRAPGSGRLDQLRREVEQARGEAPSEDAPGPYREVEQQEQYGAEKDGNDGGAR